MRSTADSPSVRPPPRLPLLLYACAAGSPSRVTWAALLLPRALKATFKCRGRREQEACSAHATERSHLRTAHRRCVGVRGGPGAAEGKAPRGAEPEARGGPGTWTSPDGTPQERALPAGPAQAELSSPYLGRCPSSPASFSSWASRRTRNGSKWRQRACSP